MAGVWVVAGFVIGFLAGGTVGTPSGMLAEVKSVFGMPRETKLAEISLKNDGLQISNGELKEKTAAENSVLPVSEPREGGASLGSGPVALNFDFSGATIQITADRVEVTPTGTGLLKNSAQAEVEEGKVCVTNEYSVPQRGNVMLSEVAWMGTEESPAAEWIELKNTGQSEANIGGGQGATRGRGGAAGFSAGKRVSPRGVFFF